MKPNPIITVIVVANLAFACLVNAQSTLTGSITADNVDESASFTPSSLTLDGTDLILGTGNGGEDLNTFVPVESDLTAYNSAISGLSSSPTSESINSFFVFSTGDPNFDTSGTTPANRFVFNLTSLTEDYISSSAANFAGSGTLVDTTSAFANTPATFSLSFTDPNDYSFTLTAVPEPTAVSLFAAGILGALAFRRRKV